MQYTQKSEHKNLNLRAWIKRLTRKIIYSSKTEKIYLITHELPLKGEFFRCVGNYIYSDIWKGGFSLA